MFALTNVVRLRFVPNAEGNFPSAVAITLVSQYVVPAFKLLAPTVALDPGPTTVELLLTIVPLILFARISHAMLADLVSVLVMVKVTVSNVEEIAAVLGVEVISGGAPDFTPYFTKILCILGLQISD